MLATFSWWGTLVVDVVAASLLALLAGWWHRRTPVDELDGSGPLLRLRPFERSGEWYEQRLRIKTWKDRLPETGAWFGELSKRQLPGRGIPELERFAAECCRGERTHLTIAAGMPVFALWNPQNLFLIVAGAGVAGNAPFVAVLRYNRARIAAIMERNPKPGPPPGFIPGLAS